MQSEHKIITAVYAAKQDTQKADDLIRAYLPFIRSEATKFMARLCTDQDDEFSIAMMGFYEAVMGYEKSRGAFFSYASMLIRSRLIDHQRKEARHQGHISIHEENGGDDDRTILDTLADSHDHYEVSATREATRSEIEELASVLAGFGVSFSDVADNSPKQERTMAACTAVIHYAGKNPTLLEDLLKSKKLPITQLVSGTGVDRKTLERHRKYILAMLLVQTNGYEIIRGHLRRVLHRKECAVT